MTPLYRQEKADVVLKPTGGIFVGRDRELAALQTGLDAALGGSGQLALLVGEPGIGKTRLAEELASIARDREAEVLWGRCWEGSGAPAFWPWIQLVRAYIQPRSPETLAQEMGAGAVDIAQVVADVRHRLPALPPPPELSPESARFRFFDGMTLWLKRAAGKQPLLLILDDLHWADTPSLLLLQFLAHELSDARLLVLGTYRDTDIDSDHPLSHALGSLARDSQRFLLSGLSVEAVSRFLADATETQPTTALVATIHEKTDGNPFFIHETIRLLDAEGRLASPTVNPAWEGSIPRGVKETIRRRLTRLPATCAPLLTTAAVVGREFGVELLRRASQADSEAERTSLLAALHEATTSRIISAVSEDSSRYRFAHALVRETLYEDLPLIDRVRLHRRIGEAIEELYVGHLNPHLDELAEHFFKATAGGAGEKALEYAIQAGERANALFAYEEAAGYYERALQLLPARPEMAGQRCELLLALGSAQTKAGESKKARATFLQVAEVGRTLYSREDLQGTVTYLARAALGLMVRTDSVTRLDQVLLDLLEEALQTLPDEETRLRARVCGALAVALYFSPAHERRAALSRQAVELARALGDTATLASSLYAKHFATWGPDNLDERLATAAALVQLAEAAGTKEIAIGGHFWRLLDLLEQGNADGFEVEFGAYLRLADELRQPTYLWRATVLRAMRALFEGRFEEGERLVHEAFARGQQAQSPNAFLVFAVQLFGLRKEQGRLQELEDALKGFVERYPAIPAFRTGLAFLHAELGHTEEARSEFEQLAATNFTVLPRDGNWLNSMDELTRVCAFLGDTRRAARLYDMLRPYTTRNVVISFADGCNGSVACYLGILATVLARWSDAEQHFQTAVVMNERFHARPFVAHAQYEYARMLLSRNQSGDYERARELLEQALHTARELGMTSLQSKVQGLQAKVQEEESQKAKIGARDWGPGAGPRPASLQHSDFGPRTPDTGLPSPLTQHSGLITQDSNVFGREGDYWTVSYEGAAVRLRDAKGLRHLAALLREPGREFHVVDLLAMTEREPFTQDARQLEANASVSLLPSAPALPDHQARARYRRRLAELRDELADAERFNDLGRTATIRTEVEFLTQELSVAYRASQHARKSNDEIEKARKAVTNRIRTVLAKIKGVHPPLWRHLSAALKTGVFCSYNPEKPIPWQV